MKAKFPIFVFYVVLIMIACACEQQVVFNEVIEIDGQGWDDQQIARFNIDVNDINESYDIEFFLENNTDYPYSNIYMFISLESPKGDVMKDTVDFLLADIRGQWLGEISGEEVQNRFIYKSNVKFPFHQRKQELLKAHELLLIIKLRL